MRIYYPVLARELEEGNLVPRPAYCVDPSSSLRGEDLELAEDDAPTMARLLRHSPALQSKAISPPTLSIIPMLQRRCAQYLTHRLKMRLTRLLHSCGMKAWNGMPQKNART